MAACLARYAEQAAVLEPMLAAAVELRALRGRSLSEPARLRAKARLRQTQAMQRSRASASPRLAGWWPRLGALPAPRALAGFAVALCLLVLSAGIVAASQPGDLAYGLRVAAERIPARLATSPETRAQAELAAADRRLEDLQRSLGRAQGVDGRAIAALLAGEEAAARTAASLSPSMQAEIAAHIDDQGRRLGQLSLAATQAQAADALRAAARRAYQAARNAHPGAIPPAETPAPRLPGKTEGPKAVPPATATRTPTLEPTTLFTGTDMPRPAVTSGKADLTRPPATSTPTAGQGERQPQVTGTPGSTALPGSKVMPAGASPTPKATTFSPAPTSSGLGPAATAPGPRPEPTSPGPGPGSGGGSGSPGPRTGSG